MPFINEPQCEICEKYTSKYISRFYCKCDKTCNLYKCNLHQNYINKSKYMFVKHYNGDEYIDLEKLIYTKNFTKHFETSRIKRLDKVENMIGRSIPNDIFIVDRKHKNGEEIHIICENGLCFVFNKNSKKLITILCLRQEQYRFYYVVLKMCWNYDIDYKCKLHETLGLNSI